MSLNAKLAITALIGFVAAFLFFKDADAGSLSFTFEPPTARVPSSDYPNGRPLSIDEIKVYHGEVWNQGSDVVSTFEVQKTETGFTLPGLVAGTYCVHLKTEDTDGRIDGWSNTKCKTVEEGPLTDPMPPVILDGVDDVPPISFDVPVTDWTVAYVSSEEIDNWRMEGKYAFNRGNPLEHEVWHSRYTPTEALPPHEIAVNMGQSYKVVGFGVKTRDAGSNGNIKDYAFQLSTDGITWKQAAGGTFQDGNTTHFVEFPETEAQYFKLIALSEQDGGNQAAVDEIYITALQST